jgi:hypothetical protein
LLLGGMCAAATVYACSSSSNKTSPPVNEAGADTSSGSSGSSSGGSGSSSGSSGGSGSSSGGAAFNCNPDSGSPPLCSSLPGTLVYMESADTQETVLDIVGRQLRDSANITLAFELTGSCTVTPALYENTPLPTNTEMLYIPSTAECPTWTSSDPELTCLTSATATTPVDVGISALFPASCGDGPPPSGIGTFNGPIQAYTFVVPTNEFNNGQQSITAEEAYYAFGDGANNPVTPTQWNIPAQFFLRPASKSTLVSTALNIGLTAAEMTLATADGGTTDGRQLLASSGDVVTAVENATNLPQAIGILGSEVYDTSRGMGMNELAFSGFGQTNGAWFPDSSPTSFDKQNLRNGNYSLWSPAVIIAPINGSGVPSNPAVAYFTNVILGTPGALPPGGYVDGGAPIDGLGATVSAGLTPDCAMQVTRSGDGAPLTPYTPTSPCTCYYLSKVPMATTLPASCTPCTSSASCGDASVGCFNGYCETNPPPAVTSTPINMTWTYPGDGGLEMLNP